MNPDAAPAPRAFAFEHSFAERLDGLYVPWHATPVPDPRIFELNRALAEELGLDPDALATRWGAAVLAGSETPETARPLAQAYAGHQFGRFVPQLGDGRALLLGEVVDRDGRRRDLHLKGSGRTPFSRGGDGKAVLGPVLREYLMGEAMHALGIATSRALAAVTTGDRIMRHGPDPEPGAVLARVASSHLRIGTFQFFAARGEADNVRRLAGYAIARHYPELTGADEPYVGLLAAVRDRQARLVARWMSVGFVHGVMNTDNTTISGETLDYGPCAFIDAYDPAAVFSSIDHHGRYAYGRQPSIVQWNLARLAEALLPLFEAEKHPAVIERFTHEIEGFPHLFRHAWVGEMRSKLGLEGSSATAPGAAAARGATARGAAGDAELIDDLLQHMHAHGLDFTLLFRALAHRLRGDPGPLATLGGAPGALDGWLARWSARIAEEAQPPQVVADRMDRVNPLYVPRNHRVEEALRAAWSESDPAPFRRLLDVVTAPFDRRPGLENYEGPAPGDFGPYVTFCGT